MFEIRFKNSLNSSTASGFIKSLEIKESFESSTEIFDKEIYEEQWSRSVKNALTKRVSTFLIFDLQKVYENDSEIAFMNYFSLIPSEDARGLSLDQKKIRMENEKSGFFLTETLCLVSFSADSLAKYVENWNEDDYPFSIHYFDINNDEFFTNT